MNLTRFSVFFPERRQFFPENRGVFFTGNGARFEPFFSRRIGLDEAGEPIPIRAGARLTARSADHAFGALAVSQGGDGTDAEFGVLRYVRNFSSQNRLGGLLAARHDHGGATNLVGGVDGFWRPTATGTRGPPATAWRASIGCIRTPRRSPPAAPTVEFDRLFTIGWGHPTADGLPALALDADASRAAVFAYEAGARMHGLVAPARRVGLFSLQDGMPEAAWAWLDRAVEWALDSQTAGRSAALIVGNLALSPNDEGLVARLRALGLQVRTLIHTAGLTDDGTVPDVLLVSESVHPDRVGSRFRESPLPVVVMKAFVYEHMGMVQTQPATWEGNAVMIAEGAWTDHLRYAIHVTQPGDYMLWLLGRDGGEGGANEVKMFFDVDVIDPRSDHFFEMRLPGASGWTNVAHARRQDNRKTPVPPVLRVERPGWHTLYLVKGAEPESHDAEPPLARRYPNWRVDRLAIFRDATRVPEGDGPADTRDDGTRALPAGFVPPAPIAAAVHELRNGYLVLEARTCGHMRAGHCGESPPGSRARAISSGRAPVDRAASKAWAVATTCGTFSRDRSRNGSRSA